MNQAEQLVWDTKKENDALRAENERLQAVNEQLKAGLDATAEANSELRFDIRESQHDLAETRRALDEARGRKPQPSAMSRRDWYICAILSGPRGDDDIRDIIRDAVELMDATDRR
jgi:hypothetical protein